MTPNLEKEFETFGRRMFARFADLVAEECCEEAMEEARKLGLVEYDDAEAVWSWRHLPDNWRTGRPAVEFLDIAGNPETDPGKCGFLRINDYSALEKP